MPPDRDLDRELRDLGPRLEYPQTPDLARSVRGRLEAEDGTAGSPSRPRPRLWWIAAAALILIVGVPVFSPAMRDMGGGAESGGREKGAAGPTRLTEEDAAGPTHSSGGGGSLAAGAGGGTPSSGPPIPGLLPPRSKTRVSLQNRSWKRSLPGGLRGTVSVSAERTTTAI